MLKMKDQSVYSSHQCTAKADSTGRRCKCRSAKGRKCWHHTLRDLNLRVKKSGVPTAGMGLYSGKRPFKKGQRVNYTGEAMSRAKVDARYPGDMVAQYTYCRSKTHCKDARRTDEKGHSTPTKSTTFFISTTYLGRTERPGNQQATAARGSPAAPCKG